MTSMTGPSPSSPPKLNSSPAFLPMAGITRTAVVLEFTMPMAASSAMIPEITSEEVSHRFQLGQAQGAGPRGVNHSGILSDRNKSAGKAAYM